MQIFSWPSVSRHSGEVVVSGRHTSQSTSKNVEYAMSVTMAVTMIGIAILMFFVERSGDPGVGGAIFVGILLGILGAIPGAILGAVLYPLFWLWFRPVTTVRVTPDAVVIDGMRYNRGDVPIEFSNLYTSAVGLQQTNTSQTMVGTFDESKGLRMYYGSNAVLVTTFMSAEKAGRFALACNAALSQVNPGRTNSMTMDVRPSVDRSSKALSVSVRRVLPGR